jgi:anti-anti-sigma regulatory factor
MPALHSAPELGPLILAIGAPIDPAGVPALCARFRILLEDSNAELVICDIGGLIEPDAAAIDALARLALTARRLGRRLRLVFPSPALKELFGYVGLAEVVGLYRGFPLQPGRQTEEREQACGVEEERDSGDAAVRDLEDLKRPRQ